MHSALQYGEWKSPSRAVRISGLRQGSRNIDFLINVEGNLATSTAQSYILMNLILNKHAVENWGFGTIWIEVHVNDKNLALYITN
jgi:hypothetical protein